MMKRLVIVACAVVAQVAAAQPKNDKKVDAKSLMQSGVKLLEAKDYLGALAVFRDAYARFPSPKILLNIGTTLKLLDRNAEAANTYQRYLDDKDADKGRRAEIGGILATIDKTVGTVEVEVAPNDGEVQLGDGDWQPAASVKLMRVPAGKIAVRARKDGYKPDEKSAQLNPGEHVQISIVLAETPKITPVVVTTAHIDTPPVIVPEGPRSRVGALVATHIDAIHGGGAVLIGATSDIIAGLEVQAAVMLGPGIIAKSDNDLDRPKLGAYVGASYAFLPGKLRPIVVVGLPVFASNGARYAIRAAAGVEYVLNRHLAVIGEIGGERNLNPETDIGKMLLVPSIGAVGRL